MDKQFGDNYGAMPYLLSINHRFGLLRGAGKGARIAGTSTSGRNESVDRDRTGNRSTYRCCGKLVSKCYVATKQPVRIIAHIVHDEILPNFTYSGAYPSTIRWDFIEPTYRV